MKTLILTGVLVFSLAATASATFYSYTNTVNTVIPDGSLTGVTFSTNLSGLSVNAITNVNVRLNITGGYNGDLHGYLVLRSADGSTTKAILLNRLGRTNTAEFGYATAGMNLTLSGDTTQGYVDIHGVSSPSAGPYLADGRTNNPAGDFTSTIRTAGLDNLTNHNANGTWTLFLADLAHGDQSTLVSWGLDLGVLLKASSTTLTSGSNPSTYGQTVIYTATVQTNGTPAGNAIGSYVFKIDGTAVATNAVVNGVASYTNSLLTATTHSMVAEYSGDLNYTASTISISQTVNPTPLGITASNTNKVYDGIAFAGGNGVTYIGFVLGETNTVLGGTLSYGGTAQGASNAGSYTLVPSGLTATNYAISYTNGTLTISQATNVIAVSSSINPSGYKDSVFFSGTLPAFATGNVTFRTNGVALSVNALSSGTATSAATILLPRGTNTVTSEYVGDGNILGSTNSLLQVVTNHPPVAVDATYTRAKGQSFKVIIADLLTNVTDTVDGDTPALVDVGSGTNSASILKNGTFIYYFPPSGATSNYSDCFTYTVSDNHGGTNTANILLNVIRSVGLNITNYSVSGTTVSFTNHAIPGYTYVLEASTNLNFVPVWIEDTSVCNLTNGILVLIDHHATNVMRVYRTAQP